MLKKTMSNTQEMYGVYYQVCGSVTGGDSVCIKYLWAGPYPDMRTALTKAEELKLAHQNDDSFIVKRYTGERNNYYSKMS